MSIEETMGHAELFLRMRAKVEASYVEALDCSDAAVFVLDLGDPDARAIAELVLEPAVVDDLVDRAAGGGDCRLCPWGVPRGLVVELLRVEYLEVALHIAPPGGDALLGRRRVPRPRVVAPGARPRRVAIVRRHPHRSRLKSPIAWLRPDPGVRRTIPRARSSSRPSRLAQFGRFTIPGDMSHAVLDQVRRRD